MQLVAGLQQGEEGRLVQRALKKDPRILLQGGIDDRGLEASSFGRADVDRKILIVHLLRLLSVKRASLHLTRDGCELLDGFQATSTFPNPNVAPLPTWTSSAVRSRAARGARSPSSSTLPRRPPMSTFLSCRLL